MLISHRYRFIYTKTVKTASTSVESFFEKFCMPDGEWTPTHARNEYESSYGVIGFRGNVMPSSVKWWNHMPALAIQELVGHEIWDSYFKFCVIRNPFDKCISAFCHFGKNHRMGKMVRLDEMLDRTMSSEQLRFFDYIQKAAPVDRDKYLINCKFCIDDIIRYESLEADIERICRRIGLPFERECLPTFKKGIRSPDATVESLYTKS